MIGPHQSKELELMLAGRKHLAVFQDALINGDVSEDIIPEKAFRPYVESGRIKRFIHEGVHPKFSHIYRQVCFTLPDHEWRAHACLWMNKECLEGRRPFDDAYEYFIGRLLGYDEADISDFIAHRKQFAR